MVEWIWCIDTLHFAIVSGIMTAQQNNMDFFSYLQCFPIVIGRTLDAAHKKLAPPSASMMPQTGLTDGFGLASLLLRDPLGTTKAHCLALCPFLTNQMAGRQFLSASGHLAKQVRLTELFGVDRSFRIFFEQADNLKDKE